MCNLKIGSMSMASLLLLACAGCGGGAGKDGSAIAYSATGAHGYLSASLDAPAAGTAYGYGFSAYTSVSRLGAAQADGVQFGWGTWLTPDNRAFDRPLCPVGTRARDSADFAGFAPTWRDVFQTVEGGAGQWVSTAFPSPSPKFRVNATPDCYSHEIASTGWSFGLDALPGDKLGLAQLSNRLLVPPDGITVAIETQQALLGYGWLALPIVPAGTSALGVPTGTQSLTLFLNASNFRGPVAFFVPETWTAVNAVDTTGAGRSMDVQPLILQSLALEVGNLPTMTATAASGVRYRRVPQVAFGTDSEGRATLMQDVRLYGRSAIWDRVAAWNAGGPQPTAIDPAGSIAAAMSSPQASLAFGADPIVPDAISTVGILPTDGGGASGGGLGLGIHGKVLTADGQATLPEYFRESKGTWVAVPASQVPADTGLTTASFTAKPRGGTPALSVSVFNPAGWASALQSTTLNDGSVVDYVWYRFIDQPAIARLGLGAELLARLQASVTALHEKSGLDGIALPPPSAGRLATIDPGAIVTPPAGLGGGYVPVVIRQR